MCTLYTVKEHQPHGRLTDVLLYTTLATKLSVNKISISRAQFVILFLLMQYKIIKPNELWCLFTSKYYSFTVSPCMRTKETLSAHRFLSRNTFPIVSAEY